MNGGSPEAGTNGGDPILRDRIRNAAVKRFATVGAAATVDEIAEAAGVSPRVVHHHFASEAELREAINERVLTIAARIFDDARPFADDPFDDLALRITHLVREHPDELRYVARAVIDGDPGGLGMFDAFIAIALDRFDGLSQSGELDPDLDVEWAALHVVVFNLATVLFQQAIEQHLPEPLSTDAGMLRWHAADTDLFRRGFLRPGPGPRSKARA